MLKLLWLLTAPLKCRWIAVRQHRQKMTKVKLILWLPSQPKVFQACFPAARSEEPASRTTVLTKSEELHRQRRKSRCCNPVLEPFGSPMQLSLTRLPKDPAWHCAWIQTLQLPRHPQLHQTIGRRLKRWTPPAPKLRHCTAVLFEVIFQT